jgi:hypothetical protein
MSTALYVDRTVDVAIVGGGTTSLFQGERGGLVCTGVVKLAQAWLIEFLTPVGSIPSQPQRGSVFVPDLTTGFVRTLAEARESFIVAEQQVRTTLQNQDDRDTPDDESLLRVDLLGLAWQPGKVSVTVDIWSRAENSRQVIVPIDVTPRRQ